VATTAVSAQVSTLYYMETVSTRHQLNPAFQPLPNVYVQLPVFPGIYFAGGNNSLILHDVIFPKNGKTVSFLHPEYGDKDKFFKRLRNNTRVFSEVQLDLLGFGFRAKEKNFFTFDISQKVNVNSTIPKDLFRFALYGTPDTTNVNRFNLKKLSANANAYTELAFGYSRNVDENLKLGGKVKLLLGQANVSAKSNNLTLATSRERWMASMNSEVRMTLPLVDYYELDENGEMIDDIIFIDDPKTSTFLKSNGVGTALDLGASYYMLDNRLHLSASVLDLGFIRWKGKGAARMRADGNFEFNGIELEVDEDGEINWGDFVETLENFVDSIGYKTTLGESYSTWLPAKIMLGIEYGVLDNKITFGLLSKNTIVNKSLYGEITTSVNFLPVNWFNTAISYSWMNGRFSNLGLGIGARLGPVNLYAAADYVPLRYARGGLPTHTQQFNFKSGLVLNFGYRSSKNDVKDECEE
jgi:hypothetical protein